MARFMFVHPHPDDETLACGGTIATLVKAGHDVTVVTCTGGEAGDNLSDIDLAGRELTDVRKDEMDAAIAALGSPRHIWLGYRDSGMVGTPPNEHPECFHQADLDEASARLAALIREHRPHAIVSDNADGTYGHPDHIKGHQVTVAALPKAKAADADVEGWEVPRHFSFTVPKSRIWASHVWALENLGESRWTGDDDAELTGPEDLPWGAEDHLIDTKVDVSAGVDNRLAAMHAHASQIPADSFFFKIPPGAVTGWGDVEYFHLESGQPALPDRLTEAE